MADEDEIDILGDFTFNSCFAQNNQGIPSCSSREDTVHPQWLLDSTATNWYDDVSKEKKSDMVQSRKLLGNNAAHKYKKNNSDWTEIERDLLKKEVAKNGRNINKLSQIVKTKSKEEIQALLDAEYGLNFDIPDEKKHTKLAQNVEETFGIATSMSNVLNMVSTGTTTVPIKKEKFKKKNVVIRSKHSLLKPDNFEKPNLLIDTSEIYYEDDLILGSTESIGTDTDLTDIVSKNIVKRQQKVKNERKIGNHRRKMSSSSEKKFRNKSKDLSKSPPGRQRKDSSLSDDSLKSPKLQIVLGSGQALPVSEGEEVIKIEKKKDSEPESDIEIDVDSDNEDSIKKTVVESETVKPSTEEAPVAVPLRKFEPLPKRQKRIHLNGGGGYTIMHTDAGDLYEMASEPRRERQPRKTPVHLIQCRVYNTETPAPFEVRLYVSALIAMDIHAHTSRAEVMGLAGGLSDCYDNATVLTIRAYRSAEAAAGSTHCEMDPVSQALAAEHLSNLGVRVCGWHHSHPCFPSSPSALDLCTQRALQQALTPRRVPFLGIITSQHWPTGRTASTYRCIRVEDEDSETDIPLGYQFSVKLVPDITQTNLQSFLQEIQLLAQELTRSELTVYMNKDVCPQAQMTYLDKCISSVHHHMRSAGYENDDPLVKQLVQGVRDVFR